MDDPTLHDLEGRPADAVRVAVSRVADTDRAMDEIARQLGAMNPSFVLLLAPSAYPADAVAAAARRALPRTAVFGCTTAGQITPRGYEDSALMAIAFRREHFRVASILFEGITPLSIAEVVNRAERLTEQFRPTPGRKRLALVIADGLTKQEDILVATLEAGLKDIPVFGGSAGDGLTFESTRVLHGGVFHRDAALLLLLETDLAFHGLGFDHFQPTDKRMVVTRAVPEERLVLEINGSPAAKEYARLVKVPVEELSPAIFAENPVLVRNRDLYHVRAIQQTHGAEGLTFLSAIDDGLLLTLGRGKEIIRTMDSGLAVTGDSGEPPDFILGFDCYLRKLEIVRKGLAEEASERFRRRRVVGFSTYGEQHRGVHVNQTFVGVAFFRSNGEPAL